jgi:SRSO17 transposase
MKQRQPPSPARSQRFEEYLEQLTRSAGHADRMVPMENYTKGLLLPLERKSVEPMAARLAPGNVRRMHQSLHHIVADAAWSDLALLKEVREQVLPAMTQRHKLLAWIVDDTGFPKKGRHSVGVTRQYCGQVGKQDNCRIAVSVSLATEQASLPARYQLYLPENWAGDAQLRSKAGVPEEIRFQTKQQIAAEQIRSLCEEGVERGVVLADAAYGNDHGFREELEKLELAYAVGIQSSTTVWPPGTAPLPPKTRKTSGRPAQLLRRDQNHQPLSVKELALCLSPGDLRRVNWREGTRGTMHSRFACLRIRIAHRDIWRKEPHPEQWLVIEWPTGEKEPTKYWLANLPESIPLRRLVLLAKQRWIVERDYQELKQELGLGHFEGRGWRGFHHHASLCIAAYGFLVRERCLFPPPPGESLRAADLRFSLPRSEAGYAPRGAAGSH